MVRILGVIALAACVWAGQGGAQAHSVARNHAVLRVSGTGIASTKRFRVPSEWQIRWSFNCANFGQKGNFQIYVWKNAKTIVGVAANQLAMKQHGTSYQHDGGRLYLQINSECAWKVTVTR